MSLALILAGAQLGLGAYQYIKGQAEQKNLKRPTYNIPDEVKQTLTDAQLRALEGLPEEQRKAYVSQIQQTAGAQINRARDLKSGLVGMAGVYQSQQNAYQNLLGQDAAARQANQLQLAQARTQMAQFKDKAFDVNQMQPYRQNYNQAQAMQGAGMQNAMGALQQGAGSLDQMQAQKMQLDYLKSLDKQSQNPLQPTQQYGANYIPAPQTQVQNPGQYQSLEGYIQSNNVPTQQQWINNNDKALMDFQNQYEARPSYNPFMNNTNVFSSQAQQNPFR